MTDGRWTQLSHAAGSAARPPKHITSYSELRAAAPPEARSDLDAIGSTRAPTTPPVADDDFIYHPIDSRKDTLMGLSLKYGVSVSELRLVNNLPTENIGMLRELRIPKGTARVRPTAMGVEDSRRSKLRKLQVEHGLSAEEATYYLEASGFDYAGAVAALKADEAFDAKSGGAATRAAATAAASATHVSAVASAGSTASREASAASPAEERDAALGSLLVDSAGAGGASSAVASRTAVPGSVGGELRRRRGGSDDGGL